MRKYKKYDDLAGTEFSCIYKLKSFVNRLLRKYGDPVSSGRNRTVFESKYHVIKVPRCCDGIVDNDWEGSVSHKYYAKSRLVYISGIPIVFAEKISEISSKDVLRISEYFDWVRGVDSMQVGYTRKGKLVAFDYGIR